MGTYRYFDNELEVVGVDETPEESCYAFVYELWREPSGKVLYASWHGGAASGGWDVWEVPAELWPTNDDEASIKVALDRADELVTAGAVPKVRDCPYCDEVSQ